MCLCRAHGTGGFQCRVVNPPHSAPSSVATYGARHDSDEWMLERNTVGGKAVLIDREESLVYAPGADGWPYLKGALVNGRVEMVKAASSDGDFFAGLDATLRAKKVRAAKERCSLPSSLVIVSCWHDTEASPVVLRPLCAHTLRCG